MAQSFFIPKTGGAAQKLLNELPAQVLAGRFAFHGLIFKTHSVLDGRLSLLGDKLGAVLDSFRERPFRDQGIDKATTKRLGRTLKRTKRNAPADFRLLELHDPRLGHAEAPTELLGGHTERVPNRAEPTFGWTLAFEQRPQGCETAVEMADGVIHAIRYRL
jgi:hypothetical protein